MAKNDVTAEIIDGLLKFAVTGTALSAGFVIPNALLALEKPLAQFYKHMDKRTREREVRRIISYMKSQKLLNEYKHGLKISERGRLRLEKMEFASLSISLQKHWDYTWRIVLYDIPERHHAGRKALTAKLRALGFYQLQQSAWIHPFPCREVIEKITSNFGLEKYVSYIETSHLDNQTVLVNHFKHRIPTTSFK